MTPLERALRERIGTEGPLTVEAFMDACNRYYYATRDPLGARGDFTTAPEISQMFGELVGACLADCWARSGRPQDVAYVELGPGRGTLAADALRAMKSAGLEPPAHFVETSPVLRQAQTEAVPGVMWHEEFAEVPDGPLLVVTNEFLDALPVRQFVGAMERKVVIAAGGLTFDRDGEIIETSPAREEVVRQVAGRLVEHGGVALFIDYGHARSAPGDTLQAVRDHKFAPVLARFGGRPAASGPRSHLTERYRSGRNGGASKASCRVTGTGVRIPPSPPTSLRSNGVRVMSSGWPRLSPHLHRIPPSPPTLAFLRYRTPSR